MAFALEKEYAQENKNHTKQTIKSTGEIGGSFLFTEYENGTVEINHKSGFKKNFKSMRETKEYFGEKF